jgi:hypothetical protein
MDKEIIFELRLNHGIIFNPFFPHKSMRSAYTGSYPKYFVLFFYFVFTLAESLQKK